MDCNRSSTMTRQTRVLSGALQMWALWCFAVLRPLLQLVADHATFLLYHRAGWQDALLLALLLCLPPLGLFWIVEWLAARIGPRVATTCRLVILFVLALLLFVQPLGQSPLLAPGWALPAAAAAALLLLAAYLHWEGVRRWLAALSVSAIVFVAMFLLAPDIRTLAVLDDEDDRPATLARHDFPDVVMVIFDGLPLATLLDGDLGIDRQLFPGFARLAGMSHWFRNASTPRVHTRLAVPAILTGNAPETRRPATLVEFPNNLFTLLDATHQIEAFEPVTRLSPRPVPRALRVGRARIDAILSDLFVVYRYRVTPQPWASSLPRVDENWGGFVRLGQQPRRFVAVADAEPPDTRGASFERFVASLARADESRFYFHHTLLPHNPEGYLASGRRYRSQTEDRGKWWVDPQILTPRKYLRHFLQAQYTDTLLTRLMDRMEAEGLLADAIFVVCADHGETFWPGSSTRLDLADVHHPDDVLRIPLMIKRPGQTSGVVDDRNVDLRDVTPAVADLLGIDVPWETEGHSPFAPDFPRRPEKRLAGGHGFEISFPGHFAPDLETRALIEELFPPHYDWRRLHRFGPMPELVGRRVADLGARRANLTVVLDDAEELADVDPASDFWPVRITGSLDYPDAPARAVLALAINGRVEATVRATFREGRTFFSRFVAEEAIRPGRNEVEVLVIDAESGTVMASAAAAD